MDGHGREFPVRRYRLLLRWKLAYPGGPAVRRLVLCILPFLWACSPSTTSSADLAGSWTGTAVTTFLAQATYAQTTDLDITVFGETATISGVCGGTPVGPGTVSAPITTIGTGTYASYSGSVTCPARRVANCESVVFIYAQVAVLAGLTNDANQPDVNGPLTLSFAAKGNSSGCGRADLPETVLIGYQTAYVPQ